MSLVVSPKSDPSTATTIKSMLRARLGRQWQVGDKLPPVKELAKQLGVGQTNTQLAVRELAGDGLLVSRRRQGTFVASIPELRSQDMFVDMLVGRDISIFGSALSKGFVNDMMDAFEKEIAATGAVVKRKVVADEQTPPTDDSADAIVLFNPYLTQPIRCKKNQLLTVVSTTRFVQIADHCRHDFISIDEFQGSMLAGQMLRRSGCKRPCFIGRRIGPGQSRYDSISSLRLHGFEAGLGFTLPDDCLIHSDRYSPMNGSAAFVDFLKTRQRPDAIFAASDDIAFGIVVAAASHGLKPGEDFQIVGFDGQHPRELTGDISLSTIRIPCAELGKRAARTLIERFNEPDRPVDRLSLTCTAFHGDTTFKVPVQEKKR